MFVHCICLGLWADFPFLTAQCPPLPATAAGSLKGVGIPIKLIHEAEGHIVTVRGGVRACMHCMQHPLRALTAHGAGAGAWRAGLPGEEGGPCQSPACRGERAHDPWALPAPTPLGGAEDGRDVPWGDGGCRGQLERAADQCDGHGPRRPRLAHGAHLHPRQPNPVHGLAGHAQERPHGTATQRRCGACEAPGTRHGTGLGTSAASAMQDRGSCLCVSLGRGRRRRHLGSPRTR